MTTPMPEQMQNLCAALLAYSNYGLGNDPMPEYQMIAMADALIAEKARMSFSMIVNMVCASHLESGMDVIFQQEAESWKLHVKNMDLDAAIRSFTIIEKCLGKWWADRVKAQERPRIFEF